MLPSLCLRSKSKLKKTSISDSFTWMHLILKMKFWTSNLKNNKVKKIRPLKYRNKNLKLLMKNNYLWWKNIHKIIKQNRKIIILRLSPKRERLLQSLKTKKVWINVCRKSQQILLDIIQTPMKTISAKMMNRVMMIKNLSIINWILRLKVILYL